MREGVSGYKTRCQRLCSGGLNAYDSDRRFRRQRPPQARVLSVLGLEDDLDVVVTMDDIERGKPDPEIDLLVAKKLGVPPEEFLVIEDSRAGVEAAVAAGMVVVAVPPRMTAKGVRVPNLLEPRWVVEDPETLSDVVPQRIEEAGGRREGAR